MSRPRRARTALGKEIDDLVHTLAMRNSWTKERAIQEIAEATIHGPDIVPAWRQGRSRPRPEAIEKLVSLGREKAGLDRAWGERLLQAAEYRPVEELLTVVWGPKQSRQIPNNLRAPEHSPFLGREEEQKRLLELLSPEHAAHLISVDGIGGVGKTRLALEVAYRCLRASTGEVPDPHVPTFDAIIFVSAKHQLFTPFGFVPNSQAQRTLSEIFRAIADTLERYDITRATPDDQLRVAHQALARQRTLMVVDNLETIQDKEGVIGFLYDLPPRVKIVLTSRERGLVYSPIRLNELSKEHSLALIEQQAAEKEVVITEQEVLELYTKIGGIPAALVWAVARMAQGYSVQTALKHVVEPGGDIARIYYVENVAPLRGTPAHQLLLARALFATSPSRDALTFVAGLAADPITAEAGLVQVKRISLIEQRDGRYQMLQLTREYSLAELAAFPDFEREARQRWIEWYLRFSLDTGGREWKEWHVKYDRLEEEWENILGVLDWCAAHDRYEDVRLFWQDELYAEVDDPEERERLLEFANIYGYWDDRLAWLEWLIREAERRGDWPTVVSMLSAKGWILAWVGKPESLEEAHMLLQRAWTLRDQVGISNQSDLARNIAVAHIRSKKHAEALRWLDISEELLSKAGLEGKEYLRLWLQLPYYRGIALFEREHDGPEGVQRDYEEAGRLFGEMLKAAESIEWERAAIFAQNWRADVAIKQGRLDEAEPLLRTGLPVAERNKDKRRIANFKRSWAELEKARGDLQAACRWAKEAAQEFERVGMPIEADEMRELLRDIGCDDIP